MDIITILLFFIYTWGIGFTATKLLKLGQKNQLESHLMRIGIGLGIFPILGVLLNLLTIPLDWKIFLVLSLAFPVYLASKKIAKKELEIPKIQFSLTKSNLIIIFVFLLFLATFFMYVSGAFSYPYLEDDDPWSHATSVKYIATEKTAYSPNFYFNYLDPYPPGYGIVMGILHQTSSSLMWTLKFFNALIISLGIIFFYFFAKEFIGDESKALFSTFILSAIPCFLSHFIWSHALIVILFFPAFYCLEKIRENKKWMFAAILVIASICVTQPTQAMKFGALFAIFWIIKSITNKNLQKEVLFSGLAGFFASFLWWGDMLIKYGLSGIFGSKSATAAIGGTKSFLSFFTMKGTATRLYTFNDFFVAKSQNMINNPIGVGIVISLLLLASLVYILIKYKKSLSKENSWILISLFWLIFTFLGIHGGTRIPVALFSFRFWMLFAIPVSLLAAEGAWFLMDFGKKMKIDKTLIVAIIIFGVLATSGYQKYAVNTAMWPPGVGWSSSEEIEGYVWLKTLPENTKIFGLCSETSSAHLIGFDKYDCFWCEDENMLRKDIMNKTQEQLHSWMKIKNYDYFIVDSTCVESFDINKTNDFLQESVSSGLFQLSYQTEGMVLMKII